MGGLRIALVAAVSFVIAATLTVPAANLLDWAGLDESENLRLSGVRGTLLRGSIEQINVGDRSVTDLQWKMKPTHLLLLTPRWQTRAQIGDAALDADLLLRPGSDLHLRTVRGVAELSTLAEFAGLRFIPATGAVSVDLRRLRLTGDGVPVEAEGILRVGNLSWSMVRPAAVLGDFRADLSTRDDGVVASLSDENAGVSIEAEAVVSADRSYSLVGRIRPGDDAGRQVKSLVAATGRPDESGWYPLDQSGTF